MPNPNPLIAYTSHYKETCFIAWYSAGRPDKIPQIQEIIPEDENGRKPSIPTVAMWRDEMGWDWRADELDAKANSIVDDELINHRVLMLKEQAAIGKELQLKGIEHIREQGFDTSSSALGAVVKGAELERTSRGISERLVKISKLSNDRLLESIGKLLDEANESGEIIDVDAVEDKEDD